MSEVRNNNDKSLKGFVLSTLTSFFQGRIQEFSKGGGGGDFLQIFLFTILFKLQSFYGGTGFKAGFLKLESKLFWA